MKKLFINVLSLTFILLSGCALDNNNGKNEAKEGNLSVDISSSGDIVYKSGEKGNDLFSIPKIEDFKVLVYNSKQEQYASFAKFSEMPSPTRLKAGNYTIVASHGANPPAAFDAPYFEGKAPFTIEGMGNTPLSLTCKIANVLVGVQYTDKFKAVFNNYSLDVMTEYTVNEDGDYESLRFTGDDQRIGYVRVAPTVYLSISLHKIDTDKDYRYGVTPLTGVKGGEYYKLLFDADARGNAIINIILNDEIQSKPLDVTLGEEYLPKLPPKINTTFNSEQPYIFRYGMFDVKSPVVAAVNVPSGIKSLIMDVNSEYAAQKGIPSTIDFGTITTETELALKALGIEYSKSIIGAKSGRVNFTKMLSTLDPELAQSESKHLFTIKVIDNHDREYTKEIAFEVLPLELQISINDYDVWAKYVKFEEAIAKDCSLDDMKKLYVEYQISKNDGVWVDILDYTIENGVINVAELKDNTEYKIRATASGVYSGEVAFKTEEAKNLPNASFEENYNEKFASKAESVIYYPYAKDEETPFWQTLNPMTTRDLSGDYYKSYPCALVVDDASNGSKAMKLYVLGWGAKRSPSFVPSPAAKTPGKLFIGDYVDSDDWDNGNKNMSQGKPFTSRPTSIDFDYKYDFYYTILGNANTIQVKVSIENRDIDGGVTVLATGSFELYVKESLSGYRTQNIALDYTNTISKATHISMSFQPEKDGDITINELKIINENGSKKTVGSALYIDNIVLKY